MVTATHYHRPRSTARLGLLALVFSALASMPVAADRFDDAVTSPDRPPADLNRDANSAPAQVLRFLALERGDVVLDLFAGGGYFSELLSRTVGLEGKVYMHNNAAYRGFTGDNIDKRLQGGRLANVMRLDAELEEFNGTPPTIPAGSVDLVLVVMAYHDIYYTTDGWTVTPERFFAAIRHALKPNGVLAIIDHHSAPTTGSTAAQELHRIDSHFARRDIEHRGFTLVDKSDLLTNADDQLNVNVFDPQVRGKTSRFLYKFKLE